MTSEIIPAFAAEFARYRSLGERSAAQLTWPQLRTSLDPETNSIAVIMKHIGGNLRSRWTDALTTDGEKPWRNRDSEFIDDFADREALIAHWNTGWDAVESALASFTDADLTKTIYIRGEAHTLALALTRSLSHIAYHVGQIVQQARVHASRADTAWQTLSIPRGGSAAFNTQKGFDPANPGASK
ncbi:MAG: DUF1572 family protein [Phycisphaerales bacterium]|nr:DUF1572 family protein [Phycisphaerales bacterium]